MSNNIPKGKFWKTLFVASFLSLGMIAVLSKLFTIQILQAEEYRSKALRQHIYELPLDAERGKIYDRNGILIATTIKKFSVAVDPQILKDKNKICEILESITGVAKSQYLKQINKSNSQYEMLAKNISPNKINLINDLNDRGVIVRATYKRHYLYDEAASQIIGVVGNDDNGLNGIELKYNDLLKGENGYMLVNRNNRGELMLSADLPVFPAKDGNSLHLTIDIELQKILEYELKKGLESSNAKAATAIAIKPETGEILAMASFPSYNPNDRRNLNSETMRIRAITDSYEPGSTFKMIIAAAAMEENIVSEGDTLEGYGGVYATRSFTIRDVHKLGKATFREAVENSSNIIFSHVANQFPDHTFYMYLRNFGFGNISEIDLPGEVRGRLPKPEEYESTSKRYMGHGYEISVTPIQMANAYSALANDGVLMKPFVVKKIFNTEEEIIREFQPEKIRRIVSSETASRVKDLFVGVVDSGSGKQSRINGLKISAKTGTSQKVVNGRYSKSDYIASFGGFFPTEDPKIALFVVFDEPRSSIYGGAVSAPVFRNITSRWINSQKENVITHKFEKNINLDSLIIPDFTGMKVKEAKEILLKRKLQFTFNSNEGIIAKQFPEPFTKVGSTQIIQLETFNSEFEELVGLPTAKAIKYLHNKGFRVETNKIGKVKSVEIKYAQDSTAYYKIISN